MGTCPYCGKETSAVKNHVRLASAGGHADYGEYPEDFEEAQMGASPVPDEDSSDGDDASPSDGKRPAENGPENSTSTLTTEPGEHGSGSVSDGEFGNRLSQARERGYSEGFDQGFEAGQSNWQHEGADTATSNDIPETCPRCGGEIMDGDAFVADIERRATESKNVAEFVRLNQSANVQYACSNLDCGYYVNESNVVKTFETPGRGGVGWGLLALAGLGAAAALGLANRDSSDTQQFEGPGRVY